MYLRLRKEERSLLHKRTHTKIILEGTLEGGKI